MKKISINDIAGFHIGQAQNTQAATGCTVVICESGASCGVEVRGGSPGTRDTAALNPLCNRRRVHAVMLAGGSAFGLDAASGVMRFLEERGVGRDVGITHVPNVCAAILFDLKCGDHRVRPNAEMGYGASQDAFAGGKFESGNYGAGTGATVGLLRGVKHAMKGGIGSAAFQVGELKVGAIVAVNCLGDVVEGGTIIAGTRADDGVSFADSERLLLQEYQFNKDFLGGNHTVLGCVITNARLDKVGATRVAAQAQNGLVRVIRPPHSVFDGDTMFAMCFGEVETTLDAVGILAIRAVEAAVLDGVKSARELAGYPAICRDAQNEDGRTLSE
jgi:L-aminopeptidase/D-esterase-like protein